jgi:hypothetical protein
MKVVIVGALHELRVADKIIEAPLQSMTVTVGEHLVNVMIEM